MLKRFSCLRIDYKTSISHLISIIIIVFIIPCFIFRQIGILALNQPYRKQLIYSI